MGVFFFLGTTASQTNKRKTPLKATFVGGGDGKSGWTQPRCGHADVSLSIRR